MVYKFSRISKQRLESCHDDLRAIMEIAITKRDISILEGIRGKEKQNHHYKEGDSKVRYPHSAHNNPNPDGVSYAVDIAPFPIKKDASGDWEKQQFIDLAHFIKGIAAAEGIDITCGAIDFKSFFDGPHIELTNWAAMRRKDNQKGGA